MQTRISDIKIHNNRTALIINDKKTGFGQEPVFLYKKNYRRRHFFCFAAEFEVADPSFKKTLQHGIIIADFNCNEADFEIKYYNIIFNPAG